VNFGFVHTASTINDLRIFYNGILQLLKVRIEMLSSTEPSFCLCY